MAASDLRLSPLDINNAANISNQGRTDSHQGDFSDPHVAEDSISKRNDHVAHRNELRASLHSLGKGPPARLRVERQRFWEVVTGFSFWVGFGVLNLILFVAVFWIPYGNEVNVFSESERVYTIIGFHVSVVMAGYYVLVWIDFRLRSRDATGLVVKRVKFALDFAHVINLSMCLVVLLYILISSEVEDARGECIALSFSNARSVSLAQSSSTCLNSKRFFISTASASTSLLYIVDTIWLQPVALVQTIHHLVIIAMVLFSNERYNMPSEQQFNPFVVFLTLLVCAFYVSDTFSRYPMIIYKLFRETRKPLIARTFAVCTLCYIFARSTVMILCGVWIGLAWDKAPAYVWILYVVGLIAIIPAELYTIRIMRKLKKKVLLEAGLASESTREAGKV